MFTRRSPHSPRFPSLPAATLCTLVWYPFLSSLAARTAQPLSAAAASMAALRRSLAAWPTASSLSRHFDASHGSLAADAPQLAEGLKDSGRELAYDACVLVIRGQGSGG